MAVLTLLVLAGWQLHLCLLPFEAVVEGSHLQHELPQDRAMLNLQPQLLLQGDKLPLSRGVALHHLEF